MTRGGFGTRGATAPTALYIPIMADLFAADPPADGSPTEPAADAPLADRLRPRALDQVIGQEHLTGPDRALGPGWWRRGGCRR